MWTSAMSLDSFGGPGQLMPHRLRPCLITSLFIPRVFLVDISCQPASWRLTVDAHVLRTDSTSVQLQGHPGFGRASVAKWLQLTARA